MKKFISVILFTIAIIYCTVPFVAYAEENVSEISKRDELNELYDEVLHSIDIVGYPTKYSDNSRNMLYNAISFADELLNKEPDYVSDTEYQNCLDMLSFAYNNLCIDVFYAKETYVLSLNEHNENNFYDENDWNKFSEKRDALRDSFKTNNEYVISYTFFELIDSFVNMTSKYTLSGDVNNDGIVNIDDATLVQKYIANSENLTEVQKVLASLNGGCFTVVPALNIDTVTELQMYFADLYKSGTKHCSYGETYVDNFGNTFNTMITMYWEFTDDRYAYVDAKVKELELEGVI